ncbi:MAG TPA: ABC transporter permease [Chitinophagaceae bacterium]|nr:ABC transporter permease [Chitinophagaceae bacterium]
MFFNYCKIAFRNIRRQKLFSFINIFGLALSMSIGLVVLVRLKDELGFDKFHPNPGSTYRIISQVTDKSHNVFRLASSPVPLAGALQKDNGFIQYSTTLYPAWSGKADANKKEINISSVFIQPSFFDVFGFKTYYVKSKDLLNPNEVILTKETAGKFFGSANPLGKTIQLGNLGTFVVADVMQPPPGKSHIEYDAYLSFSSIPVLQKNKLVPMEQGSWNPTFGYTYVVLKQGASKKQLLTALNVLSASAAKVWATSDKGTLSFDVQSLSSISPGEELYYSIGNIPTIGKVMAEVVIAIIILISACFNYTNLSIAKALKRGKEVGIRKVAGAFRLHIFAQFVIESVIVAIISLFFSYVIFTFLKSYAPFSQELIPADLKIDAQLLLWFMLFGLGTGILAGVIPAWILSSFRPVQVLKNLANVKLFGRNGFRKTLTVIQFSLSLVIIIFMMVFAKQFNYMATADYGFNRTNIISMPLQGADYNLLKTEVASVSGVQRVAGISDFPGRSASGAMMVKQATVKEPVKMSFFDVDENYIPNMQLQLLAGNDFAASAPVDERYVIINENAVHALNISSPANAVGKTIFIDDSVPVQVAGVIKDFHFEGFEQSIKPLVLRNRPKAFNYLAIKTSVDEKNSATLVAQLQAVWKQVNPLQPFNYSWFDKQFRDSKSATGTVSILGFLAFIAITIACLGLLGMVIYTTETRVKEVSIRKVIGAGIKDILSLLGAGYLRLIIISILIAAPIGWLLGYMFLSIFAIRVSIGLGLVALASAGMLLIALIVICSQLYRMATANPVNGLRME